MQKFNLRNIIHILRYKALIFLFIASLYPTVSQAQFNYMEYVNKKFYFGITLGVNISRFKWSPSEEHTFNTDKTFDSTGVISSSYGPGFNLGIITNLKLGKYFDLRFIPALSFAEKSLKYQPDPARLGIDTLYRKSIQSIIIEFPLLVRFKSQPIKDIRIYVVAGMKYSLDLASNAKSRKADDQVKVSRHDVSAEVGLGLQIFFPLFIFSPEVKWSLGVLDVHSRSNLTFSRSIDQLFSRGLIISFHFEG